MIIKHMLGEYVWEVCSGQGAQRNFHGRNGIEVKLER